MTLHLGPCSSLGQGIFSFFFCVFLNHIFLRIGLFSFIPTAAPLQLPKVLHSGKLYSSVHCDLCFVPAT